MKKNYLKQISVFVSMWVTIMTTSVSADAATSPENIKYPVWKRNEKGWWVENPDGSYYTNTWYLSNGLWYYLGDDGYMLINTITPDGHLVGEDGAWIINIENNHYFAIINYSTVRDDFSQNTTNGRKLYCYFDRTIFEGTDDNRINWINAQVENVEAQFKKEFIPRAQEYLKILQESLYNEDYSIAPHQLSHVYYDDSYVSIGWERAWYAGGVDDSDYVGLNLNAATQSHLSLTDVLGENAYDRIINAVINQGYDRSTLKITENMLDEINFYFDADAIYISVDPGLFFWFTGGADIICIPR